MAGKECVAIASDRRLGVQMVRSLTKALKDAFSKRQVT